MKLSLFSVVKVALAIVGSVFASGKVALSQVTPDNTNINTQVNRDGSVAEITGGQTRGGNLFHSFDDFSVPTNNEAYFNNANDISNIFSRVTGGNISNIDGAIRANGSASLFLINPAGIIFSENARLDIGGSFYGSTASSILFKDNEFSAVDNLQQPILTVNAPIGLGFQDNPGDIINRSFKNPNPRGIPANQREPLSGLEVLSGKNIGLFGGDIITENGAIIGANNGKVMLGGLSAAGTITILEDNTFLISEGVEKADVNFSGAITNKIFESEIRMVVEAREIQIDARNINFTNGAGISTGDTEGSVGEIVFNATDNIIINEGRIGSLSFGVFELANINITAKNLTIGNKNRAAVNFFRPSGILSDTGNINIDVSDTVFLADGEIEAGIGNIQIEAKEILLTNVIENEDSFESSFDGSEIKTISRSLGNSGDINLTANIITVNTSRIATQTSTLNTITSDDPGDLDRSQDTGGNINVSTESLSVLNSGKIAATTRSSRNAGNINIIASEKVSVDGNLSEILSESADSGTGNAGNVEIVTPQLTLSNNGFISTLTSNLSGDAGDITIDAAEFVEVNSGGLIGSDTDFGSRGNGGSLTITTPKLTVSGGGFILSTTRGGGQAGDINIFASDSVEITGTDDRFPSNIQARAIESDGAGGTINIVTGDLTVSNEGIIDVGNFPNRNSAIRRSGTGKPGNINIQADLISIQTGGQITSITQSFAGNGANIDLQVAEGIILQDGGLISAEAINEGNGGNLNIDTDFVVAFLNGNNDIIASAEQGQGGNININAESLFGIEERPLNDATNDINASSAFSIDGEIEINTPEVDPTRGIAGLPDNVIDATQAITRTCLGGGKAQESNKFVVTGRGGLPTNPNESLSDDATLAADWVSLPKTNIDEQNSTPDRAIHKDTDNTIVEAKGWKVDSQGKVILTAKANSFKSAIPWLDAYNCDRG